MNCAIACALVLAVSFASALPLENKNHEKYILLPVRYKEDNISVNVNSYFEKRNIEPIPFGNRIHNYQATLMIGSPGQPQNLDIDIGCSNSWIYAENAPGARQTYDPTRSSTYHYVDSSFNTVSLWESVMGCWVSDTVTIGGSILENQPLGLVTSTFGNQPSLPLKQHGQSAGILCLGYDHAEQNPTPRPSINVLQNLCDQGYITRKVYSLFLDETSNAISGSVLFGAVDSKKYTGPLKTIELTSSYAFEVKVGSVFVGDAQVSRSFEASLDCNTFFSFLPASIVRAIAQFYGAEWNDSVGTFVIEELPSMPLIFDFCGVTISVDPTEIFLRQLAYDQFYGLAIFSNFYTGGENYLGTSFLRSAYVVFDLERHQISLAQSSFNSAESNIIPIIEDIPGATHV